MRQITTNLSLNQNMRPSQTILFKNFNAVAALNWCTARSSCPLASTSSVAGMIPSEHGHLPILTSVKLLRFMDSREFCAPQFFVVHASSCRPSRVWASVPTCFSFFFRFGVTSKELLI